MSLSSLTHTTFFSPQVAGFAATLTFFITLCYVPHPQVAGFTDKAMHVYMAAAEDPLRIAKSNFFGGTLPQIECAIKAFNIALHQTLSDGYLGTDEQVWAIVLRRLPHLFADFDNNSLGNHGDNCASFSKNAMEEKEIDAGTRQK